MNNKSNLSFIAFIFLASCTDNSVEQVNVSRAGSSLEIISTSDYNVIDSLCPATCEVDYECCPDYQAWHAESMMLATENPECELSCCIPEILEEDLICGE